MRWIHRASCGRVASVILLLALVPATSAHAEELPTSGLPAGASSHWAFLEEASTARRWPNEASRVVARVAPRTFERTTELVLILSEVENAKGERWYQVRLPVRPNNSTGWLPERSLGEIYSSDKRLIIDRARFTATLIEKGQVRFRARVGVGKPAWPTPAGEFYVRSRLPNASGIYGPLAFGTSATSDVLTDWPGGGFIGLHGTDQPQLLPGRVSHGCVRFSNRDILRLGALISLGTPITIR